MSAAAGRTMDPGGQFSQQLRWVLGGVALATVPHAPHLPGWILLIVAACGAWRLTVDRLGWRLPPRPLRIVVAFLALLGVLFSYRTLNGLDAGTALLVLMAGVKLLETRTARDLTILVFLAYFLVFAGFLYDQALLQLPYMLLTAWVLTATLMRVHQSGGSMTMRAALGQTGRMLLMGVPLAALLFVFFPRLPGQFWALPARASATTGLTEEMSPGDVSELSISSAIAFRVKFEGALPPPAERYWRGPVLHDFDGRTWRLRPMAYPEQSVRPMGPSYRYRVTIEPHQRHWVFPLDLVTGWTHPRLRRTHDHQLLTPLNRPISTVSSFELESSTAYRIEGPLPVTLARADTRLPEGRNPRANALARELRARAGSDAAFVDAVLEMFRREAFYYTLEPPRLEADSVDDFLFNTRRGFCEHFASAFTALARAAGIPARVVTGYQGGEYNPLGDYLIVRQSDAHAWSEVWLEGRGWVRVDPTAAVAPERIERGLDAAIAENEPLPGRLLRRNSTLSQIRLAWDAINTFWQGQIVEFGLVQQRSLLARLGVDDAGWKALGAAIGLTLAAFFLVLFAWLAWRFRPRDRDPVKQAYDVLCRRLARRNLARRPGEGPSDYLQRIARARPELARELEAIRALYISLRYHPAPLMSELGRLKHLVNQLRA